MDGNVIENVPIGTYKPSQVEASKVVSLKPLTEYIFTVVDLFGDGMSNPDVGFYSVTHSDADCVLVEGGGDFGSSESTVFSTCDSERGEVGGVCLNR